MGATHCILKHIAANRVAANGGFRIKILNLTSGIYMSGKWRNLKYFSEVLSEESMGCKSPFSLTQIVCRHICYDLTTYQSDEKKYKLLPTELLEKINEEAIFCLNFDLRSTEITTSLKQLIAEM